ncbi:Heat shock transcription factor [Coemansia sp. IMI 209128]|nr:Heat shock transcription factor [Coemansia sp. IMI 209128]
MAFKYAIYSNEENWSWIRWNEAGDKLLMGSWELLINALNDLGFGATQRTSVMKNFYSYGFKLESDSRSRMLDENGVEWIILQHDHFVRGRPDLLKKIKRRTPPPQDNSSLPL